MTVYPRTRTLICSALGGLPGEVREQVGQVQLVPKCSGHLRACEPSRGSESPFWICPSSRPPDCFSGCRALSPFLFLSFPLLLLLPASPGTLPPRHQSILSFLSIISPFFLFPLLHHLWVECRSEICINLFVRLIPPLFSYS